MLVGIYCDSHFSVASSILNKTSGYKYSARLDLLIESFKWMYEQFKKEKVELIVNAGDLIDSDFIKAREGSALAEALSYGGDIPEYHLVGNHEKEDKNNKYTSISLLDQNRNRIVVSEPTKLNDEISLLPYTSDFESLDLESISNKILISHMNYEGMSLGRITLATGINMDYILSNFELVLNGHIHTASSYRSGKILNVGSMFGHGFDDNYELSYPCIMILDTDSLKTRRIVNPHSALFLKYNCTSVSDLTKQLKPLLKMSNPKCIKVEVPYAIRDDIRDYLETKSNDYGIIASRIHGKVENSTIIQSTTENIEKLKSFESGAEAMRQFTDLQADDTLPAPKSEMMSFLDKFILMKE